MRRVSIDKRKLCSLYKKGVRIGDLSKKFGCTKDTIRNRLKEHGVYQPAAPKAVAPKKIPPYRDKVTLSEAYEKVPSTLLLAERFGVSFSTINTWLKRHGVSLNTKKATSRADRNKPWTHKHLLAKA